MKKLLLLMLAAPMMLCGARIFMAGDSTMARYPERRAPLTGWGMALPELCADGVKVSNFAVSGTSTKSFRTPKDPNNAKYKQWDKLISRVKPGDFVIIQFGINDAASGEKNAYRHTDPETSYKDNLKQFIAEVRAKKATPVLCTQTFIFKYSVRKKVLINDNKRAPYVKAAREVAKETNVDFVDLNAYAIETLNKIEDKSTIPGKYYMTFGPDIHKNYPKGRKDTVHFNPEGAKFYAEAFVKLAKQQNLPIAKLFK